MCTLEEKKRLAYDKAIEGYQFQVGRYNTWMNYYAIFVGALFVALYNIWPSAAGDCACCKGCHSGQPFSDCSVWFLPIVISILGLLASICWYGALLGYHTWNSHWMGVIQKIEKGLNGREGEKTENNTYPQVYCDMPEAGTGLPYSYMPGFVSTQKITGFFICWIMLAWIAIIAFAVYSLCGNCCCACISAGIIGIFIMIVSLFLLHCCSWGLYSSKIVKR